MQIGEPEPGSPLLFRDHDFNVSSQVINERFPGSEELFIIAANAGEGRAQETGDPARAGRLPGPHDGSTRPSAASKGVPDLVMQINQMTRNDDPRWGVDPGPATTRLADSCSPT